MEEKKNASMGPQLKDTHEKMSYEDLNNACMNLSQQNQQMQGYIQKMHTQMQQMEAALETRRMDYLFKVVEFSSIIKDAEFLNNCIAEIKEALTIPENTEESKKN